MTNEDSVPSSFEDAMADMSWGLSDPSLYLDKPCTICRGSGLDPEEGDRICWCCRGTGGYRDPLTVTGSYYYDDPPLS